MFLLRIEDGTLLATGRTVVDGFGSGACWRRQGLCQAVHERDELIRGVQVFVGLITRDEADQLP